MVVMSLVWPMLTGAARFLAQLDSTPADADVKAGWGALVLFLVLILAVAFLGFSLSKQLRKAQAARDAGVYGDPPAVDGGESTTPR